MTPVMRALGVDDLEPLHALEVAAQPLPWSDDQLLLELVNDDARVLGLFTAGHTLDDASAGNAVALIGHVCTRKMVDELWVLNIAVHPDHRRHGHARRLLESALQHGRAQMMTSLWLEVRESNAAARALYGALGLEQQGRRPDYYPPLPSALDGKREAAILMSRAL